MLAFLEGGTTNRAYNGGRFTSSYWTSATIEVHHVFSEVPPFGALVRPLHKTDLEQNKTATG